MLYLTLLLGFVFFAGIAMTVGEGLWNNTITLISVILSSLLGIFGGLPLGIWVLEKSERDASFTWYFVFGMVWGLFFLSMLIQRLIAGKLSDTRMKFVPPLEMVAGPLMGLLVAVMFTSFVAFTLERVAISGESDWDLGKASEWQRSTFAYARTPFLNVLSSVAEAEQIETSFISKKK